MSTPAANLHGNSTFGRSVSRPNTSVYVPDQVKPRIAITQPDGQAFQITMPVGDVTIGRRSSNSVVLRDVWASGVHAVLRSNGQTHFIIDFGSRNGVFVNGERIAGSRLLADGDQIRIGLTQMQFSLPVTAKPKAAGDDKAAEQTREHKLSPRMRAARIDFVGRVIAQMFTVLAALIIGAYLFGSVATGCGPGGY
jgi:pSer/pThr/pTyr-binding forkhead associated (FHA) protein